MVSEKLPWGMTCLILLTIVIRQCLLVTAMRDIHFDVKLEGSDFLTVYGHSLLSCQEQCANRLKCKSINYRRHSPYICTLNSERNLDESTLKPQPGWVYQGLSEWETLPESCPSCSVNKVCEYGTCVIKECEPLIGTSVLLVYGNINTVNGKAILACSDNKYPKSPESITTWPVQTECTAAGYWTITDLECSDYEPICHNYLVSSTPVSWSRFKTENVNLVDGPCGVEDSMLSASSIHDSNNEFHQKKAKFSESGAWVTNIPLAGQYIEVRFNKELVVSGIKTKGRAGQSQWVTKFKLKYTTDCSIGVNSWSNANDSRGQEAFMGNSDDSYEVINMFVSPIRALCVRIYLLEGINQLNDYGAFKFDLIGMVNLPVF